MREKSSSHGRNRRILTIFLSKVILQKDIFSHTKGLSHELELIDKLILLLYNSLLQTLSLYARLDEFTVYNKLAERASEKTSKVL